MTSTFGHTILTANIIHITNSNEAFKMSFEPKQKVELDPPKDDIISLEYLSKCDGKVK